ncbi:MAG: hypothetical protein JSS91_02790 [Bacteroidetes bacterium]|nr:hypothetical protein [Bacteroidota bacterium]
MKTIKKKAKKYIPKFSHLKNKHYTEDEISILADEMLKWFEGKNNFWLKDFAISKRIPRQRISEFCKSNEYFNYVYLLCNDLQESKLVKLGLVKKYNAALPIFALKNNCGWNDKNYQIVEDLPDFELKTIEDIAKLNSMVIKKILKNDPELRYSSGINNLLNLQIKSLELLSIEKRIEKVEEIVNNLPASFEGN